MEIQAEYFDDGSSFIAIDPVSINPGYLLDFSLFDRYLHKKGQYRFRCLLLDSRSIPKERLMELLRSWDQVYIHKNQNQNYTEYVKNNLEFILNHGEIDVRKKTQTLTTLSTQVINESFAANFASKEDCIQVVQNIEKLISQAMEFISDIESLKGIADLIGHDYQTHTHSIKVGWLTATFINANKELFGVKTKSQLRDIMIQATVAGFLHDIGKIKIPRHVINKEGKLSNIEYVLIQSHTAYSTSLLFETQLPRSSMQTILYHHENEDGSGYPCGLSGDQIPLIAKICHIADVFDALTSKRPYKPARTPYEALKIMAGENPYLEILRQFEAEVSGNPKVPVVAIVRDDYEAKLRRLREREMLEEEAQKRVEARNKLRDKGMSHCFDKDLLRRFILTINKSESFDLSGLL
ncbi:MAG: HD domain-containing protein [Proteobacteria bacterium]|nr:HD domain-containing protein [Pseudomonadota bacterium]MBU4132370.1 HD domain-containing protein [Pseudomonadota bacterium]